MGWLALLGGIGYLTLTPLVWVQYRALDEGASAYGRLIDSPELGDTLRVTVYLAIGSVAIALVLGTVLAWCAYSLPPSWGALSVVPILPLVLPPVASITGWIFLLAPRIGYINVFLRKLPFFSDLETGPVDLFSVPWIVLLTGFSLTSFVYVFVLTSLKRINPSLLQAAQVYGRSQLSAFLRVGLPLLRPALVYSACLTLILGLGQFTAPLILGRNEGINVITTEMYLRTQTFPVDFGVAAAYGSPLLLVGILLVVVQRLGAGNRSRYATLTGSGFSRPLRASRWPAIPLISYCIVAVVLPFSALLLVALSPYWSSSIIPEQWTIRHFSEVVFDNAQTAGAIRNSLWLSGLSLAVLIPLGLICAHSIVHGAQARRRRLVLETLVSLPLALPAVLFGIGALFTFTNPPFVLYGTPWVILFVYITIMLPHAVRLQTSALTSLGDDMVHASRIAGAGIARTMLRIVVPLLRPALGSAAALIFILLSHEFGASLLVRSGKTQVMGTVLYDLYTFGSYSEMAAMAVVMTLIVTVGVIAAVLIGGRDVLERL